MVPQADLRRAKTGGLIEPLRRHVAALSDDGRALELALREPAQRGCDQRAAETAALRARVDADETDLAATVVARMTREVRGRRAVVIRHQDGVRPTAAALLDPRRVELVAALAREPAVGV